MTTTTLSGFNLAYNDNGDPIYRGTTSVDFTYDEAVKVSYSFVEGGRVGILDYPEIELRFTTGHIRSSVGSLDGQAHANKLLFVDGSFASIVSVYTEEEDQDYIFIIDSNPEFTAPTNQASLEYLLNNIQSVDPVTGKFAPNTEFSLSDIPAGVSTEDDTFEGDDGSDTINAGTGNDIIYGRDGDDTLEGGSGDDKILGGLGDDWIDGGVGSDRLAFWDVNYTEGVQVDLSAGTTLDQFGSVDTLLNIENANGTDFNDSLLGDGSDNGLDGNAGDDLLRGYGGSDDLWGREGDDEIYGGDDRDFLIGFAGHDFIDGESGNDVLRYDLDAEYGGIFGVEVNLAQETAIDGFGDFDTVKNIYEVRGTQFDDTMLGGDGEDKLIGGDGNDTLDGGTGNDILQGGAGDDTLDGGAGINILNGGEGDDTYISNGFGYSEVRDSGGIDTAYLYWNDLEGSFISQNPLRIGNDFVIKSSAENTETFRYTDAFNPNNPLEFIQFYDPSTDYEYYTDGAFALSTTNNMTDGGQILYVGTDSTEQITAGNFGNRDIYSNGGDDTIDVGDGYRWVFAGSGDDIVVAGEGETNIFGEDGDDQISTGAGDDTLNGGAGNDTLDGGAGNDTLDGGIGNDLLTGGEGLDAFVFRGVFDHDVVTDFSESEDSLEFYADDGSLIAISELIESTDDNGNRILSTSNGLSSVTFLDDGITGNTPAFDIALTSESNGTATFEIYADELVDPDNDGIGAFQFTLTHDPSDLLIDVDSIAAASGFLSVPNYNATTGVLEIGGIKEPTFKDLSTPIITFDATILDKENPLNLAISNAFVDSVVQSDVVETFDFSSVSITATAVDRFGDDLVLPNDDIWAFEISGGDQLFVREGGGSDTNTVIEIVANPTSEFSALDFDLTDYAGLTDFTLSDVLSNWTFQTNETFTDQVSFSGFSNNSEIPAGQETVLATFTTAMDPDFDISGIKLDGAAGPDISVGEIQAASTNGNVTVFEVSSGTGAFVNADKSIDEASEEAIGAYDALQALRLAVGLDKSDGTSEWHDYLAADINKDGRVGADDALDILKFAVGLTDGAPADWIFVDRDADWSGVNRSNTSYDEGVMLEDVLVDTSINMTGILVGDLDGSYIA